jgi:hypothetical protein
MARVVYGNLEHSVPQRVLMVGLGGGSIAATLMQWHKLLRIDALESSRKTVSAYENHFVPAYRTNGIDTGRLRVLHCDVLKWNDWANMAEQNGQGHVVRYASIVVDVPHCYFGQWKACRRVIDVVLAHAHTTSPIDVHVNVVSGLLRDNDYIHFSRCLRVSRNSICTRTAFKTDEWL